MTCIFCSDPASAGELVYEDARSWVLLHPDWSPRGHAMVVAKQHAENASALDEEDWLHLARVFRETERVLLDLTQTQRAIAMKLGIQTPHLHLHIYPMADTATREEVFEAIEGKRPKTRDEEFVRLCRSRLTAIAE